MSDPNSGMSPERWALLQSVFEQALALEPAERAGFIATACGTDFSLREQLLALVFASGAADAGFEEQIDRVVSASARDTLDIPPGDVIGAYRIEKVMGRGGMGTVYLAQRADEQYRQRVAVKVMANWSGTGTTAARFRSERQILANLVHPNISRLLDGGTTAAGLPYLVMEYIEGEPLDEYCDRRRLPLAERLELFRTVCAAVHFAHQNLVVHRDLKPSNILVTGEGTVKLLDFGIAKLLRAESVPHTVAMTVAVRLMTPEHASPEQLRGETITTASDVYSLGVLFYELLCGRKPYRARPRAGRELEAAILERMPTLPSIALMTPGSGTEGEATPESIATARSSTPERLRQSLKGDLDTIVLVAMRKEADRRYSSAQALADDVERHLRNLPVAAQADSVSYRARKFVRRHRTSLVAGVVVILGVAALTGVYTKQLADERDRAAAEALKSSQVASFLTGMFEMADPAGSLGRQITVMEMLDRGASDIESQLVDQPLVRADLMHTIGFSYMSLGEYDRAVDLIGQTLALKSAAGLHDTREYAKALYDMAGLKRFQNHFVEAESLYREALEIQQRLFAGPHGDTAASMTHLAVLYHESQRFQESVVLQEQALEMTRAVFGDRHAETANRLNNLALPLQELNRHAEADVALRTAIDIQIATLAPRHPDLLNTRNNLALLLRNTGRYMEAEKMFREILAERREVLGSVHPRVGTTLNALGGVLTTLGTFDEAGQLLDEAYGIQMKLYGSAHARTGNVLRQQGNLALARGQNTKAEAFYRRELQIERALYGDDASVVHATSTRIAGALLSRGERAEAARLLDSAYTAMSAGAGVSSLAITATLEELAKLRSTENDLDAAAELFSQALHNYETVGGVEHPLAAGPLLGLAEIALRREQPEQAQSYSQRAFAILGRQFPADHWQHAVAGVALGRSLMDLERIPEATPLIDAGHARLNSLFGERDARTLAARAALTELRSRTGQLKKV